MTESSPSNPSESIDHDDRRSSVRVRSRLPCAVESIDASEIPKLEARILDAAVIESDAVMHDAVDWRDHSDELSNEMVFMLNEVRALRQQLTEVQRLIERHNEVELQHRWVELNVRGLWLPTDEGGADWKVDEFASVRVQIPSIQTPEILAVARVVRIDEADDRQGTAFEFCSISKPHQRAISSYALRRERQKARSERLDIDF